MLVHFDQYHQQLVDHAANSLRMMIDSVPALQHEVSNEAAVDRFPRRQSRDYIDANDIRYFLKSSFNYTAGLIYQSR